MQAVYGGIDLGINGRSEEALILAGGAGRRMLGRDKGRMPFRGNPLVFYPLTAARERGLKITISCNRFRFQYRAMADQVVSDHSAGYPGPLVALSESLQVITSSHCVIIPCDTPFFSAEHLDKLLAESRRYPDHWIVAVSRDGVHPLHAVFPMCHFEKLKTLVKQGERRMMRAMKQFPRREIYLPSKALTNVNHLRGLSC
ncbi:MAG: molybdenum cofactor guanylyltransferase [Pontibacterium sp.]